MTIMDKKNNHLVLCDFSSFARSRTATFFWTCLVRVYQKIEESPSLWGIFFLVNLLHVISNWLLAKCFAQKRLYWILRTDFNKFNFLLFLVIRRNSRRRIFDALFWNSNMSYSIRPVNCKVHKLTHFSPFLYLLKTSVRQRFSTVFRGCRKGT